MAKADLVSFMPLRVHHTFRFLRLSARRELTKYFRHLQRARAYWGVWVGLLFPHAWVAELLCFSLSSVVSGSHVL